MINNIASDPIKDITDLLFSNPEKYGLISSDLMKFASVFINSSKPTIKAWAIQQSNLYGLERTPMPFEAIALNDKTYNLQSLRGKVVLLDFWNTTCAVCIAKMPALKELYDKYKSRGFEVLSISIDAEVRREAVQKIHEKIGANWPVFCIGGATTSDWKTSLAKKIWDTYGFQSVPQLILLDKNGLMACYRGVLLYGDFEPLLVKLLTENYSQ